MKNYSHFILLLFFTLLANSCANNEKKEVENIDTNTPPTINKATLKSWEIENSVRALEVINENTIWYAGSASKYGYTTDGGNTWQVDSLKINDKTLAFRAIAATDSALFLLSIASPTFLFKTTDWGKNWDIVYQENDTLSFYNSMAFWDNKKGIATGDPIGGCLSIITTKDGGDSWQKIPCEKLPLTEKGEAEFAASNTNISIVDKNVWIATGGTKARVFHSADYGDTWEVIQTPIIEGEQMTGIYSVDFFDNNQGIIFGGDWNNKTMNSKNKALTTDGGKTWALVADSLAPGYRSCVQYISEKTLIAVGSPGISYSYDGGNHWNSYSTDGFYTVRISPSKKTAWLAGKNKLGNLNWD